MPFHSSELLSWQRGARKGAELFLSFENLGFPSRTEPLPFHSTPRDKRGAVARGRCSRQGNTPRDRGDSSQELLASLAEAQGKQTEHVTSSWARRLLRDAEAGWEPGFVWMCIQGALCHAPGPGGGTSRAGSSAGSGLLSTQNSSRGRNFAAIPPSSSGLPAGGAERGARGPAGPASCSQQQLRASREAWDQREEQDPPPGSRLRPSAAAGAWNSKRRGKQAPAKPRVPRSPGRSNPQPPPLPCS